MKLNSEDRSSIVAMVTNSLGSDGLKSIVKEKKSGIFLRFRTDNAFLSRDLKSEPKMTSYTKLKAQSIQKQKKQ